jgi:hypothetical protein
MLLPFIKPRCGAQRELMSSDDRRTGIGISEPSSRWTFIHPGADAPWSGPSISTRTSFPELHDAPENGKHPACASGCVALAFFVSRSGPRDPLRDNNVHGEPRNSKSSYALDAIRSRPITHLKGFLNSSHWAAIRSSHQEKPLEHYAPE